MPYKLLKFIVSHIRRTSPCPDCNSSLREDDIILLASGASSAESYHALFYVICAGCGDQAFVFSDTAPAFPNSKKQRIHIETKPIGTGHGKIEINDVLDMHNFLKTWHGDVKELF